MAKVASPPKNGSHVTPSDGPLAPRKGVNVLLILAALVVLSADIFLWPYLGLGIGALGLWALALLISLRWVPRFLKKVNLWAGALVLIAGGAGVLSLYHPGWGGSLGSRLVGEHLILGGLRLIPVVILASWLLSPGFSWRATRFLFRHSLTLARRSLKLYRRYPLHRPLFRLLDGWLFSRLPGPWRRKPQAIAPPAETPSPTVDGAPERVEAVPEGALSRALSRVKNGVSPKPAQRPRASGGWDLPALDLLDEGDEALVSEEDNLEKARLIEETLSEYGIEVSVEEIRPGPVVTLYGLVPGWIRRYREVRERDKDGRPKVDRFGYPVVTRVEEKTRVKVDAVLQREKDLAMVLAAQSLRFEAPVPGEPFVGLEVPNAEPSLVALRSLVADQAFRRLRRRKYLPIALGKGSGGEPALADLIEMPHLLIAGSTGSGKSVCINALICCLLMQFSPYDLRLLLVDPKRVELTPYNGTPHLLTPVVVEAERAIPLLRGLVLEMKHRYKRLEEMRVRNIQGFNQRVRLPEERMPYVIVVIDELADLMMSAPVDVEQALCRLAQLGRAIGIHLIVATQRPSVDVLTGLIKANFPSRISFAVSSQIDSRVILDSVGAEKLLGRGDMLFLPTYYVKPKRLQGVFISDEEISRLVEHWTAQHNLPVPAIPLEVPEEETEDEMLARAQQLASQYNRLSTSLLQRRLGIGYPRAARLLDRLEEMGIVEAGEPGRSRGVLSRHERDDGVRERIAERAEEG